MEILSAPQQHRRALRDLQGHLASAGDGKLREIVALVDSMPERGAADALIAPLRGRLTQLRPRRRFSLNRFLFMPADPVITQAAQWRRSALVIPRSALGCMAQLIRREFGADDAPFAQQVDGVMSDDRAQILHLGQLIWPRAAAILESAHVPPEWAGMTGLTAHDFTALARPLAVLLGEAVAIEHMLLLAPTPHELSQNELAPKLRDCLARALVAMTRMPAPENTTLATRCIGLLLTVLLARMPAAEPLLVATGDFATRTADPIARLAADSAVDTMLDQAETRLAQADCSIGVGELTRVAALIDALETPGPACRPSRKPRAIALRRALDVHCRHRFEADLAGRLLMHIPQLSATATDESVLSLEDAALDLRRLEAVGRAFGGAAHYERALAEAGQAILKLAGPSASRVDLARLTEILLGPEAALAVLEAEAGC